ncbi:hypothetical protein PILCRDRAFT_785016 [Piloderma croceum F 1598]|uniref:GAG-pre-integrase domain-containing protein n=1 Tax=Piloderma croceum (strain F 1598) TaxID=765440 RepID=A0A0C3FCM2_PILCF|nr:hypothetical protein PILCRDRAFT_785016 [Piloderma croceum F 1598]
MEKAQNLFSTNDPILSPLNTLVDLDHHTVESVNLNNSTVIVKHGCTVQELNENEKPTNLCLKQLKEKIKEQEHQAAKSEADMYRLELLSQGIQGLNEFLWTTVLEQCQWDKLNAIGIHDISESQIDRKELAILKKKGKVTITKSDGSVVMQGHIHEGGLCYLAKHDLVTGLNIKVEDKLGLCDGCTKGKHHQAPFPHHSEHSPTILDCLHMDLQGPFTASIHDYRFTLTVVDDHSRIGWKRYLK